MKILYDSDVFSNQTFGGISRYFVELMNHLPSSCSYDLSLKASENEYLPLLERPVKTISLRNFPEHRKLYHFINGFADRKALRNRNFDIFHPTGFLPYFEKIYDGPYVVTVHDMTHHRLMDKSAPDQMAMCIDKVTRGASRIIAISEATKKDILNYYDIDPQKIDVIYHGFNPPLQNRFAPLPFLPEQYILFVGHRGGYKNFKVLLEAFSMIASTYPDLKLVCTGKPFTADETRKFHELGLGKRIISRFIAQPDMNALYANARCFIFPSKLEGFGMPVLEAFAVKCPVILSDASCLPEIGGSGALYFDPDSAKQLATQIKNVLDNKSLRKSLIAAADIRLKDFSWDKTAELTAATYLKALEK